ncbi:MAG: acetylornithine deacetylase [Pseudomonadales bacterium]|nr:acetylornithine deacetylase [Pseudomonadales bacterium]
MPKPPALREMIERLIAAPSISSTLPQYDLSNQPVVDLVAEWLDSLGFDVKITQVPGREGKSNLVATLGSGTGGLVLSGHTDTVPMDEGLWRTDPFQLTEIGDKWYGLGTCDMKSFIALAIEAARPYADQGLTHPLTILATADEESSMSGARALAADDLAGARFAVIGEPTELAPVTQHKGIMMLSLVAKGSSGHSSNPALGRNALDGTARILDEICDFRDGLRKTYQHPAFEVDYPTLNLGCIHGGDNPNRICDHVDLSFDLRVLPGMDNDIIKSELEDRLAHRLDNLGLDLTLSLLHPHVAPFESSGTTLAAEATALSGIASKSVAFATEAPFLTDLGLETIVMGPGSIDQAHQPNEFIETKQLAPTIDILRGLIEKHCLAP